MRVEGGELVIEAVVGRRVGRLDGRLRASACGGC